mmetsp:Transcript_4635/g.9291  ORF Transcript_4635/g.9291 Transcript_4635/m.9291 type:complete len:162 (-) Transcript_4635:582-1067(-)
MDWTRHDGRSKSCISIRTDWSSGNNVSTSGVGFISVEGECRKQMMLVSRGGFAVGTLIQFLGVKSRPWIYPVSQVILVKWVPFGVRYGSGRVEIATEEKEKAENGLYRRGGIVENDEEPVREEESVQKQATNEGPREFGGPPGYEPTRYGDWAKKGRVSDF